MNDAGRIVFSPDGEALAAIGALGLTLWDASNGKQIRALQAAPGGASVAPTAFSHDGRRLASISYENRTVSIYDVATGAQLHTIAGPREAVTSAQFSPDGRLLVTTCNDGAIRVYDATTFSLVYRLQGHQAAVRDARFLSNELLATVGDDRTLRLWRLDPERKVVICKGHTARVWRAAFSPDGNLLASASTDGTVRLWNPGDGSTQRVLTRHGSRFFHVDFAPDGTRLVTSGEGRAADGVAPITLWDVASGEVVRSMGDADESAFNGIFSPDGRYVVTTHRARRRAIVWNSETGELVFEVQHGMEWHGRPWFSPDSKLLATAGADNSVVLWDVPTGTSRATLRGQPDVPESFWFLDGGKRLLSGGKQGSLLLWDVAEGRKRSSDWMFTRQAARWWFWVRAARSSGAMSSRRSLRC